MKKDLITKLTKVALVSHVNSNIQLADQFAPDNEWFINTMTRMFLLGGNLVPSTVAYNLLVLVCSSILSPL